MDETLRPLIILCAIIAAIVIVHRHGCFTVGNKDLDRLEKRVKYLESRGVN